MSPPVESAGLEKLVGRDQQRKLATRRQSILAATSCASIPHAKFRRFGWSPSRSITSHSAFRRNVAAEAEKAAITTLMDPFIFHGPLTLPLINSEAQFFRQQSELNL